MQTLIEVWVDPIKYSEICAAKGRDYLYSSVCISINSHSALLIKPTVRTLAVINDDDLSVIKVEKWKEGIVIWIGGEIAFKSWKE